MILGILEHRVVKRPWLLSCRQRDVLAAFDGAHVLGALERGGVSAVLLAHAAFHLRD